MTEQRRKKVGFSRRFDDRGVASTVGTIMAIMVILALLSLVTNHYVPVWMNDGESSHMETALTQLGTFKTTMDNQMLFAEVLYASGVEFSSTSVYTAVKLGSDGVPVFAAPTQGELGLNSDEGAISVSTSYTINATDYEITEDTAGNIELFVPNRYFVPQTLAYENGALIRQQNDGEVIVGDPQFSVSNKSGGSPSYDVSLTLVWLFGTGSASGSGLEGISSKLLGMNIQQYANINASIYINHTTNYGEAWYDFYNETLTKAYNPADVVWVQTGMMTRVTTSFYEITLTDIGDFEYTVSVELMNTDDCLKNFKLRIAYIDVAIGRKKGGTEV